MAATRRDLWFWILLALAIVSAPNAVWMLAAPSRWYANLPAAVPDFGPYNEHFVRDIGCAFLTFTVALAWAALRPSVRTPLVVISAFFFGAHAVLHVYDTSRGLVDSDHWWLDLPGVYGPAALLGAMAIVLLRRNRAGPPDLRQADP